MRILSGTYKGRRLQPPPAGSITRPITGLAKKSVFDTLAPWLGDAVVVDLYCGTGTMGLEALSRGASRCCFAERDRRVIRRLQANIRTVGATDRASVWPGDVERKLTGWLEELGEAVDVAFVDPPYAQSEQWRWDQAVEKLFAPLGRHLADDGVVVLRTPDSATLPGALGPLACGRTKAYGNMIVTYWQIDSEAD